MFETANKFTDRGKAELCADCHNSPETAEKQPHNHSFKVRCIQHNPRLYIVAIYDEEGQHVGEL